MTNNLFGIKPIKVEPIGVCGYQKTPRRTLRTRDKHILYERANKHCEGCGKKIDFSEM